MVSAGAFIVVIKVGGIPSKIVLALVKVTRLLSVIQIGVEKRV